MNLNICIFCRRAGQIFKFFHASACNSHITIEDEGRNFKGRVTRIIVLVRGKPWKSSTVTPPKAVVWNAQISFPASYVVASILISGRGISFCLFWDNNFRKNQIIRCLTLWRWINVRNHTKRLLRFYTLFAHDKTSRILVKLFKGVQKKKFWRKSHNFKKKIICLIQIKEFLELNRLLWWLFY